MSDFIKQYGRTMIFALAAALVLTIVFRIRVNGKTGLIAAVYAGAMEGMTAADVTFRDADAAKAAAARRKPEITFQYAKIRPQKETNLQAMLTAEDADGRPADCVIVEITDAAGTSILDPSVADDKTRIKFPSAGIYIMEVKAADCERKTTSAQFRIPVTGS